MMTFTMGNRLVQAVPQNYTKHRLQVYELRPLPGVAPPYPFMERRPDLAVPKPVTRPAKATPKAVKASPAPGAIPAPATTKEDTMPRTTTTEKTAKINAALAALKLQPLTEAQATVLLQANAMSPKRVIKFLKEGKAAMPEGSEGLSVEAKPLNTAAAATAAALHKAITQDPKAGGVPAGNVVVSVVGDKPRKAKATKPAAQAAA